MTNDIEPTDDTALFRAGPNEFIEYARTIHVTEKESTDPLASEAQYDVVVATAGDGHIVWENQSTPFGAGSRIDVPPGVRYSLTAESGKTLEVIVFGVGSNDYNDEEK